jgi:hypothetical protein
MSLFGSFWKKGSGDTHLGRWQVGDKIANCYEICKVLDGGRSGPRDGRKEDKS